MLRLIPILALTLMITPVLNSQDPYSPDDNPVNPEMQRQEIINLERETARAILLNNGTFFRRVYAEDFAGTLSHGQTVDKTHLINEVQNGGAHYQSFNASDIQVRIFRETAIATCLWTARGFFRGQETDSQMRVMHVYINGPRGWHVVAGQTTQLPPYTAHPL
jgi:ketosteroid isomerase-like protein